MPPSENFIFLNDPSTQLDVPLGQVPTASKLDDADHEFDDSIVEKWGWIFERIWYTGHIYVMTSSLVSIFLCLTRQVLKPTPRLIYRSTFLGATFTYTLSLLQNLNGASPGFFVLLPLDTFQYIILSTLWMVTIPHTIKLLPFALFSLLHVADTASSHHSGSHTRARIVEGLSDKLAPRAIEAIGYLDIWLLIELVRDCILIRAGAVVSLCVFGFFYRVRLMYSPAHVDAFMHVYHVLNNKLSAETNPKFLREFWIRLRNRFSTKELKESGLHKRETEAAIEMANIYGTLDKSL